MPDTLTPGDGQDVLARYKQAREGRDVDAMMELFSETAEVRLDPFAGELRGSVDLRAYWNEVVAQQAVVEFDAERVWVSGRTILASWHEAHTRQASDERIRVRGFSTLELDDEGLVARMRSWPVERVVAAGTEVQHG